MTLRGEPLTVYIDDVVRLRKPHPCGGFEWTVVRLGADIGLRCNVCGRKVLLPRRVLEKRLKAFVSRGPEFESRIPSDLAGTPSEAPVDAEVR